MMLLVYIMLFYFAMCLTHAYGIAPIIKDTVRVANKMNENEVVCESDYLRCLDHLRREDTIVVDYNVTMVWIDIDCSDEEFRTYSTFCNKLVLNHYMDYFVWFHVEAFKTINSTLYALQLSV